MKTQTITKPLFYFFFAMTALGTLAGCSSSDDADTDTDPTPTLNPLFACLDEEFEVGVPLSGPGYDAAQGGLLDPQQDSYLVHTTQIFVPPEAEDTFFGLMGPVIAQLNQTPGLLAYSLASDAGCGDYRTMGIWEDEDAMFAFVLSDAHAQAMQQTSAVAEAARVTHWTATVAEVNALNWSVAKDKIRDVEQSTAY